MISRHEQDLNAQQHHYTHQITGHYIQSAIACNDWALSLAPEFWAIGGHCSAVADFQGRLTAYDLALEAI